MDALGQDEIRASFVNCTRGEAKGVTLPAGPEEIPWEQREFLGWRDPKAPARAYLVLPHGGEVVGLALRAAPPPKSRLRSNICGFCTTTHGLADITLFSAKRAGKAGREGNTLGIYACGNLACCRYVRGDLKSDVPQPFETLTLEERIARLEEKLHKFVARVLESR
ncbi:FBP domain-containing protein [Amycolatopsis sp. NPDC058278]|uniref:FBP domain-containing protein n=1 Tax=Amycolatopsis sp. NPDC058278 TaxID=3346417 RepID=UPI0036D899DC